MSAVDAEDYASIICYEEEDSFWYAKDDPDELISKINKMNNDKNYAFLIGTNVGMITGGILMAAWLLFLEVFLG